MNHILQQKTINELINKSIKRDYSGIDSYIELIEKIQDINNISLDEAHAIEICSFVAYQIIEDNEKKALSVFKIIAELDFGNDSTDQQIDDAREFLQELGHKTKPTWEQIEYANIPEEQILIIEANKIYDSLEVLEGKEKKEKALEMINLLEKSHNISNLKKNNLKLLNNLKKQFQ